VTPGKWASVWKQRITATALDLRQQSTDEAIQSLHEGSADVALVRMPFDGAGLSVIPLYEELAVVVAAKDHPIAAFESLTMNELSGETLLAGHDLETIELVAANLGVAIMPQSVARLYARRDVVARPLTDQPSTRIALAWRGADVNPLIEEFVGIVRGRTANSSRGSAAEPAPRSSSTNARGRERRR